MKCIKVLVTGLGIIILTHFADSRKEWLDSFKNYIVNKANVYQIMVLIEQNKSLDTKVNNIVEGISENHPILKISFQDATKRKAQELSKLFSFPQTMITVIIHLSEGSEYMNKINGAIEFVSQISESRSRSRCLIILSQEQGSCTYFELLQRLWFKQFLDVTILELTEATPDQENYLFKLSKEVAIIHQYNPFNKSYTRVRCEARVFWFPDKTQNLHRYEMKVGLFAYPPLVYLERNETGDLIKVSGPGAELTQGLSKAMNFSINWISPKNETSWGDIKCSKENSTGHIYRLMNNEIQFTAVESGRFASCDESLLELSRGTKFNKLVAIMHIITDDSSQHLVTWKKYNVFAVLILLLFIWILAQVLRFDKSIWSLLNIMEIVLGLTAPREPLKLAERIVFGAIILSCMMNSTFIYTTLTDVSLALKTDIEVNTTDQLLSTGLQLVTQVGLYDVLAQIIDGSDAVLLKNVIKVRDHQTCFAHLLNDKNRVCLARLDMAKWVLENNRDSHGRPSLQIVDESLVINPTALVLEARSPYVGRFEKVILRLVQSGLDEKWQRTRFNASSNENLNTHDEITRGSGSMLLQKQVVYVFLFGNGFAIITFLCEVLFAYFKKKFNYSHSRICRN